MIESKTIIVPTESRDVKLHQMLAYNELKPEMDEVQRQLEAVAIFCELTMSEVKAIPFDIPSHDMRGVCGSYFLNAVVNVSIVPYEGIDALYVRCGHCGEISELAL